jgi:hypothetical protein
MAKRRKSARLLAGRAKRCKYVATRGTKRTANKLATELRRDGFRPLVSKTYGGARIAWTVFSCPPASKRRKRRRR